jgi:hypothetical protein
MIPIDQHQQLIPSLGGIDDDHAFVHIDLVAASSTPGAAYMVSAMSRTSERMDASTSFTGAAFL